MTNDKIFFYAKDDSRELLELTRSDYPREDVLQLALATAPEVIAGFTTNDERPTRLLLIKQEMAVGSVDGKGTMRIDHLYSDTSGVPVLVEVKLLSDGRIRRYVVAQILEYAANAAREWTSPVLRSALELIKKTTESIDELLQRHDIILPADEFIGAFVDNLTAGHIRMMIVADEIPESLRRIIEFLNSQMSPAEILGVEVPQYTGTAGVAYVPRLVGQTTLAKDRKIAAGGGQQWDEESFLLRAGEVAGETELEIVQKLIDHVRQAHGTFSWGHGVQPGVGAWYTIGGKSLAMWILRVPSPGATGHARLEFRLPGLIAAFGFAAVDSALGELEQIPSARARIAEARKLQTGWPSIALDGVTTNEEQAHLFNAVDRLKSAQPLPA